MKEKHAVAHFWRGGGIEKMRQFVGAKYHAISGNAEQEACEMRG